MKRYVGLDILRGLMALSIMFYHLVDWNIKTLESDSILGRLGIYSVSIFFILSGFSMAIVYSRYIKDLKTSLIFFLKRIIRIWPLYGIAVFNFAIITLVTGKWGGSVLGFLYTIGINVTTLFGIIAPKNYVVAGGWSIGNEIFYYLLTPLIIMSFNKNKKQTMIGFMLVSIISLVFSFRILSPEQSLGSQWETYINPLNNLFFYYSGIVIYYLCKDKKIKNVKLLVILLVSATIFILYPVVGDQINITTGINRLVFSLLSMVIVYCFYKIEFGKQNSITKLLEVFGIATYGIYLLHPIVNFYIGKIFNTESKVLHIGIVSLVTIALAILSFYFFEKKISDYGKKKLAKLES